VAAGSEEKYRTGFGPAIPGFDRVPYGDLEAVAQTITGETAAIVVEPIQGEGGIFQAPQGYLAGLRALADQHGLMLVFDEVQTGIGRTGALFGYQGDNVAPDIMALAKGLGGGFPLGACVATEKAASGMTAGMHGSTFGGNPLAMAVAEEVLAVVTEPGFLDQVMDVGQHLRHALEALPGEFPDRVTEVRGRGLMLGLKVKPPVRNVVEALLAAGLLTVPAGDNVIRLLPPLILSKAEADQGVTLIRQVLSAWKN